MAAAPASLTERQKTRFATVQANLEAVERIAAPTARG
jgi:hypothetical protein